MKWKEQIRNTTIHSVQRSQERRKIEETEVGHIEIIKWVGWQLQIYLIIHIKGFEKIKD